MEQLELAGKDVRIRVNEDVSLSVLRGDATPIWDSSKSQLPSAVVQSGDGKNQDVALADASDVSVEGYNEERYSGHTLRLGGFGTADISLELVFAIDAANDELLLQVEQVGGSDTVVDVKHFYRFEKPVSAGGYMIIPHGSGYLIPADCPDELPGDGPVGGFIGARWTMPMFGMVRGEDGICAIVDTWWDCNVEADHVPGEASALDFNWIASLGRLDYPRRLLIRFAAGMDHVAMAKLYRNHAKKEGFLKTLEEKAKETPVIKDYIDNILFRWPAYKAEDGPAVLEDIRKLKGMGFDINFFYPKWSGVGYSEKTNTGNTAPSNWQAYIVDEPVPGGWKSLSDYSDDLKELDCLIQGFIALLYKFQGGPEYDEGDWALDANGEVASTTRYSTHDELDRIKRVLDTIENKGLRFDVLYFDGYSAYSSLPEDFSPAHPVSRRQAFADQNAGFSEARRRGIMPGGELARFWCIADCDYFFFTDWSSDRLVNTPNQGAPAPVGEPLPIFQLVFSDCFIAGFSSGGYAIYTPGYDWWEDHNRRLYEILFGSAPAHNWLVDGHVPIRDWDSSAATGRWSWLKRWNAYHRAVATSEMVSHEFLSADRKKQRIKFANDVVAELDMAENKLRISGVDGFSGEWESPEEL